MKYLHLDERFVMYELPFARGLQYQTAIIAMEGGEFSYIATQEEIEANVKMFENIISKEIDDYEFE